MAFASSLPIDATALSAVCRKWGVVKLSLFGSVLRGDFASTSDVDVLVEFAPGATPGFFGFEQLRLDLIPVFSGRDVDLVTAEGLSPFLRERILRTASPRFAA